MKDTTKSPRLTVSTEQLYEQVAEGVATTEDGEHLQVHDLHYMILTNDGVASVRDTLHFLDTETWPTNLVPTCSTPRCVMGSHHTEQERQEEQLVLAASRPSLATLLTRAKKRGLLAPQTDYT